MADSVAVNTPEKMPPRMITGSINTGMERHRLRASDAQPTQVSRGYRLRIDMKCTAAISETAISNPGTKPARNSLPTDTPAILPYTTSGMLGGMIGPMVAEVGGHHRRKRREDSRPGA